MTLQRALDWSELALKVLSCLAIVAAGIWGYYQFVLERTDIANIQLTVSADSQPYSSEHRLLVIHARPKNIGKVLVKLAKFNINVRRIPEALKPGVQDLEQFPSVYRENVLRGYEAYELEPGVEYDDLFLVVVAKGSYLIEGTAGLGDTGEVDHMAVVRVDQ